MWASIVGRKSRTAYKVVTCLGIRHPQNNRKRGKKEIRGMKGRKFERGKSVLSIVWKKQPIVSVCSFVFPKGKFQIKAQKMQKNNNWVCRTGKLRATNGTKSCRYIYIFFLLFLTLTWDGHAVHRDFPQTLQRAQSFPDFGGGYVFAFPTTRGGKTQNGGKSQKIWEKFAN